MPVQEIAHSDWQVDSIPVPTARELTPGNWSALPPVPPELAGAAPYTPKVIAAVSGSKCYLAVGDALNHRIHLLSFDGAVRSTITLPSRAPAHVERLSQIQLLPSGELVAFDAHKRNLLRWHSPYSDEPDAVSLHFGDSEAISSGVVVRADGSLAELLVPVERPLTILPPRLAIYSPEGTLRAVAGALPVVPSGRFSAVLAKSSAVASGGVIYMLNTADGTLDELRTAANGVYHAGKLPSFGPVVFPSRRIPEEPLKGGASLPIGLDRPFRQIVSDGAGNLAVLVKWLPNQETTVFRSAIVILTESLEVKQTIEADGIITIAAVPGALFGIRQDSSSGPRTLPKREVVVRIRDQQPPARVSGSRCRS